MQSLHGHLGTVSGEDLVGDDNFFLASPPVLVAPDVAPVHKVGHRQHRDAKPSHEGGPSDDRHEKEGGCRGEQAVLQASELILLNPSVVLCEVALGSGGDVGVVDEPVDELTFFFPAGCVLSGTLLVESLVGLLDHLRP